MKVKEVIFVSACLCGVNCRYNGRGELNLKIKDLMIDNMIIPVCPEQLGGLTTPRDPCEIKEGLIITYKGDDLTAYFNKGALEVLKLMNLYGSKKAILKERSPSCGVNFVYDGSFTGKVVKGEGLLSKLLRENDVLVVSEDEI